MAGGRQSLVPAASSLDLPGGGAWRAPGVAEGQAEDLESRRGKQDGEKPPPISRGTQGAGGRSGAQGREGHWVLRGPEASAA